jgi:peptide deformylase
MLSYDGPNGKRKYQKFNGYIAQIIQHEVDHLNGVLI